jgi:geranylgeranyl pyrophosphate synthase
MSRNVNLDRRLLRGWLQIYLNDLPQALRGDVVEALNVEGKLFHQPASAHDGRWALLPFCLSRDLKPGIDAGYACGVALAVECVICATDLFDDVMDEDITPLATRLGEARMLNTALALIYLAQRILLSLAGRGIAAELLSRLMGGLQQAMLLASAGQQQDLLAEGRSACELTPEECIEIASAKAGSLLSLACQLGAICAGVDETLVAQCTEMGRLLGIAAQLENDAQDLSVLLVPLDYEALAITRKSDLARSKKTLPIVLAAHSLRTTHAFEATNIDSAFRRMHALMGEEREIYVRALREGILATWGIALLYRERARDCLGRLEDSTPLSQALRHLLGFVET